MQNPEICMCRWIALELIQLKRLHSCSATATPLLQFLPPFPSLPLLELVSLGAQKKMVEEAIRMDNKGIITEY